MKVIMEFDLPSERENLNYAENGWAYFCILKSILSKKHFDKKINELINLGYTCEAIIEIGKMFDVELSYLVPKNKGEIL